MTTVLRRVVEQYTYKTLHGFLYLSLSVDLPTIETKSRFLRNDMLELFFTLLSCSLQVYLAQILSLSFSAPPLHARDQVLIKTRKRTNCMSLVNDFLVLLTTKNMVKTAERDETY